MKGKEPVVIGIDLGGTKIYCAVVNSGGKILATARKKTKAAQGFENTVERIAKCAFEAVETSGIDYEDVVAAGIGSPGPLDLKKGKIIETPNLKWTNAPLQSRLESLLKLPVRVDNDGNVGVLGEHAYGTGKGADHLVGLFIGTGIGGGVIVDGKLLHGFNENAGELGHMILDPNGPRCGCGNKGCMEAFASRLAIEREIRIAALHGIETGILDGLKDQERIRSKRISEAYDHGDPAVKMAVTRSAEYIGYGVASLLNVFNPEVVVLGGGVVEALGDTYVDLVRKVVKKRVFKIALRNVRIEAAKLKDDSAVMGAAKLAWDLHNSKIS
jgi:glucokinase